MIKKQNNIKRTIGIMVWVMKLVYSFGPKMMIGIFVLQLVSTVIPFVEQKYLSTLIDRLVDYVNFKSNAWVNVFIMFFLIRLLKILLTISWHTLDIIFDIKIQNLLTNFYLTKVSSLDYQQFENKDIANLKSKVDEEYRWRTQKIIGDIFELITQLISFTTVLIILIPKYWYMAILLFIGEIPSLIVDQKWQKINWKTFNFYREKTRPGWDAAWQLMNKRYIAELKIMKAINFLKSIFIKGQNELSQARTKNRQDRYLPDLATSTFSMMIGGFCMLFIIKDINLGNLTLGMFTFYFSIIRSTGDYFSGILSRFVSISEQSLYINDFRKIVEYPKVIESGKVKKGIVEPISIEFENVSFRYPNTKKYIYKNLNLKIDRGEEIAIVGPNGAGKTTLIKLICRFYDPTCGRILINGTDLKKYDIDYWYKQLSLLTQEFTTYENLSLADNVALSDKKDRKRITRSLKQAEAFEFTKSYKDGLETLMSQRYGGEEPSWGQWQKIAIARLFYHQTPLMILDEPTASIDAISESRIFTKLYKQIKGKTLIIVSHRFSTVRNAKRIIVIKNGVIVEQGSHDELVKSDGLYAKSFKIQAKGYY